MEQANNQILLPQQPQPQKKNKFKTLLFLEIGLFEIGFVVIALVLVFAALNYFKIIKLRPTLSLLSSLPHSLIRNQSPTPVPLSISTIQSAVATFAANNIQPALLPKSGINSVKVKKSPTGFLLAWTTTNPLANIQFIALYDKTQTQLQELRGFIYTSDPSYKISSNSADMLIKKYFIIPSNFSGSWHCANEIKGQNIICDQFSIESKTGYGIITTVASSSSYLLLTCSIPSTSQLFSTVSSCTTGLQGKL